MESSLFPISLKYYVQDIVKSSQLYFEIYLELKTFSLPLSLPAYSKSSASVTQINEINAKKNEMGEIIVY